MQNVFSLINTRGSCISVHADIPSKPAEGNPFVIALHGLDSNFHEYGLYDIVAGNLANNGITCLRFDFAGNGESEEPFINYTHKNMLDDIDCVYNYAIGEMKLSPYLCGIQGYSMGGRAACLSTVRHPDVQCISLWAPGVTAGIDMIKSFLKTESDVTAAYKKIIAQGEYSYNPFGIHNLTFNAEFFKELKHSNPLEAIDTYSGSVFCAIGEQDTIVSPVDMELIQIYCENSESIEMIKFPNGGHDLGTAYGRGHKDIEIINTLTSQTTEYFVRHLHQ